MDFLRGCSQIKLKRFSSNWLRLVLLILVVPGAHARSFVFDSVDGWIYEVFGFVRLCCGLGGIVLLFTVWIGFCSHAPAY